MESTQEKHQSSFQNVVYIIDNLIHILIVGLLFYLLWLPICYYKHLLSWHAILGTLAFLLLMSESITLLSSKPWFTKFVTTSHERKIWSHGILFTIATIFAVISVFLEYHRKDTKYKRHFQTWHGITALLATVLTVFAFFTGLSVSNCQKFQDKLRPVVVKLYHNLFGQLSYSLGMLSLMCSYFSNWIISKTSYFERIVLVALTLFITVWILNHAIKNLYHQAKAFRE